MPDFAYIARNSTGQKIAGSIAAASEREAISLLVGKSLFPVKVAADKGSQQAGASLRVSGHVMTTVYSQMAALLRSGVPLLRALAVLKSQSSNKNLKAVLEDVYRRVEDGTPLGDAFARYPRAFSEMA